MLLVASIDAYSPDVYTKVKGFDRLDVVRTNLRRLLRLRKEMQSPINLHFSLSSKPTMHTKLCSFDNTGWTLCVAMEQVVCGMMKLCSNVFRLMVGHLVSKEADGLYETSILQKGFRNEVIDGVQIQVWVHEPWQFSEGKVDSEPEQLVLLYGVHQSFVMMEH